MTDVRAVSGGPRTFLRPPSRKIVAATPFCSSTQTALGFLFYYLTGQVLYYSLFTMPRRQTNLRGPKDQSSQKKAPPKRKAGRSLDAFAIAEKEVPKKLGVRRNRLGDDEDFIKRKRDSGRQREDSDGPGSKRRKTDDQPEGSGGEDGNDSEGNEWKTGEVGSDDDSDLDSDEAMGASDDERFEGFAFRGSSTSKPKPKKNESRQGKRRRDINLAEDVDESEEEDADEEDDDDLGEDAVDLTTAWDMNTADEAKGTASKSKKRTSEEDLGQSESEDGDSEESENESELSMSEDEPNADGSGLSKLQNFVNAMNTESTEQPRKPGSSQEHGKPTEYGLTSSRKLTVADLLPSITDSRLKNSLKHVDSATTQKAKSSGVPGKLDAPLAKRQQDRMDRGAAYEKSKETLDRWLETVKANRRADHLMFPLPDPDAQHTPKMDVAKPQTDLEGTIQNILVESGLTAADGKSNEDQLQEIEEQQTRKLPIEEIQARRAELRKRRDLLFREEVRSKRIKKIKSKSYRRRHRKEREKMGEQERQALIDAGVDIDEEEREKNERKRAEARMGSKHRDSKWAKSLRQTGRTAWDEDARNNAADLAQKEEDLRKRVEGKRVSGADDDYLGSSSSESEEDDPWEETGSDVEKRKISQKLGALDADNGDKQEIKGPHANLFSMKFMQNAEASRKAENDAEVRRLNRELHGEESESEAESEAGRRKFGQSATKKGPERKSKPLPKNEFEEAPGSSDEEQGNADEDVDIVVDRPQKQTSNRPATKAPARPRSGPVAQEEPAEEENPWLVQTNRNNRRPATGAQESVDITVQESKPDTSEPKKASKDHKAKKPAPRKETMEEDDDSDEDGNVPVLLKNHDLVKRAFAGDEVVQDFEQEKLDTIEDEGDKVVDNTLPGWGSWTGEGISKNQKKKQKQKRDLTRVEGVKPEDRKDAKLSRVIINEKRVRKVRDPGVARSDGPMLTVDCLEQQVHGDSAASPVRDEAAVRAVSASSYRAGVVDEGNLAGLYQASRDGQTGRHQADGKANGLMAVYLVMRLQLWNCIG